MDSIDEPRDVYLTTPEAARMLGVRSAVVKQWADNGLLKSFRTPGGHRRIFERDVLALRASQPPRSSPAVRAPRSQPAQPPPMRDRLGVMMKNPNEGVLSAKVAGLEYRVRDLERIVAAISDALDHHGSEYELPEIVRRLVSSSRQHAP